MSPVISLMAASLPACWGFHEDWRAAIFQARCLASLRINAKGERWDGFKGVSTGQYCLAKNQTNAHLEWVPFIPVCVKIRRAVCGHCIATWLSRHLVKVIHWPPVNERPYSPPFSCSPPRALIFPSFSLSCWLLLIVGQMGLWAPQSLLFLVIKVLVTWLPCFLLQAPCPTTTGLLLTWSCSSCLSSPLNWSCSHLISSSPDCFPKAHWAAAECPIPSLFALKPEPKKAASLGLGL